ncbi:hypothetical protein [Polaromonas sp.]|uniref:hypothetical protein n=1 Tax=Polaromonas sp. TaxID=1869339 RepID=UPI0035634A5E
MTTTYTQLQLHLSRYEYKRGQYTGDAPADYRRRAKNNFRVRKFVSEDAFGIKFYNANLITAYPNGDIVIDCAGWGNRVTTGAAMYYALSKFGAAPMGFGSGKFMGLSQLFLSLPTGRVVYYDGIRLNEAGEVISELRQFKRKQIDKVKVKALNEGMAESGFKDVFRLLHSTVTPEDARCTNRPPPIVEVLTSKEHAEHWPTVIAQAAFFNYNRWYQPAVEGTGAETWARVMNAAKSNMYEVIETDITKIGEMK